MVEYRKKKGSDTWHWCRNCNNWPISNYDKRYDKPSGNELCNECIAKDKKGQCTK